MKSKRQNGRWVLAAVCMAVGLGMAGCGDATTFTAQKDANEAARRASSAGEPRAKNDLVEQVAGGADLNALENEIKNHLDRYVEQLPVSTDLQEALKQIKAAAATAVEPGVKSQLNSQLGATQLRISDEKYLELQEDMAVFTREAIALQGLMQGAIELGSQADVLQKNKPAPPAGDVDKARAAVTQSQQVVAAAQDKIKKLQDDIAARENEARQVYTQTDSAFQAADLKKGKEAIDAGNQAMVERRKADQLMADAGNLQPQLSQTQAELKVAQIHQTEAEQTLAAATASQSEANTAAQQMTQRIDALRAAAKKIVQDQYGIAARYKAFADAAAKLDAKIKDSVSYADQAATSYGAAGMDYQNFLRELSTRNSDAGLEEKDKKDPLVLLSKDPRMGALLTWSKAAAQAQSGSASLAGFQAATLADTVNAQAAKAFAAAGLPPETKVSLAGQAYKTEATTKFTEAVGTAKTANSLPPGLENSLDKIKWIGFGIEALAQHGLYLAGGNKSALDAARVARDQASARNPLMAGQLSWIAQ